MYARLQ